MVSGSTSPVRLAVAGMIGLAGAMGIGRFVYTPILPGMMADLGLTPAQAGWIASANYLGYLAGALLAAGGWAARHERRLALGALAATAILTAAMAGFGSVWPFAVIRFLAGLASAFVMVFLSAIVFARLAAAGRPELQRLHFSGVGVGIAISALIMLALTAAGQHWQAAWLWSALACALGFAAVAATVGQPAQSGGHAAEPKLPRSAPLMRLIIAYGLFGFGYIVTATFLITIVRHDGGSRSFEAIVWLVTGLAIIPSLYIWSLMSSPRGPTATFIACCAVEAVGVAASVNLGGSLGPLLGGALLGATFVAATAYGLQAARLLAPDSPRRVFALMTASFGVGQILGPIVAGVLAGRTGNFFAASMLAALLLIVAGALVWPDRRLRPA